MSLLTKLLLVSLLTLILPWAGWRYAQQMERTLRQGQESALLTTAEVLGRVVASEPELLYRVPELRQQFAPEHGDYFAPLLPTAPLIDGFDDEWPVPSRHVPGFDDSVPKLRLGVHGRNMHVYAEVVDSNVSYETPTEGEPVDGADRLIVLTRDAYGHEHAWSISAVAPGPIIVRACNVGAPWKALADEVPNVTGVWRPTGRGYAIELRGLQNLFGVQLAVFPLDSQDPALSASAQLGWLHTGSESLKERLEQYAPAGLRVSVIDTHGWLLARAGSIAVSPSPYYPGLRRDSDDFVRSIYRSLFGKLDTPPHAYGLPYGMWGTPVDEARDGKNTAIWFDKGGGEPSLVRAAVPVKSEQGVIGALLVEQPGEQLIVVRERAITQLINLTLAATLFAVVVAALFGVQLSHRIRRLSRAAATALTPEGRIEPNIPGTEARDELGALARSYDTLLTRVKEYTSYLQTLGTKLSHELRTPLTIVSSSLENLQSEDPLPVAAQSYVDRARDGAGRMHAILTAMTEATRVEQSIEHTERMRFDLSELVRNMGQAYRATFSHHRVEVLEPGKVCTVDGAPDLIAQLLDKLMDNAADFCPPGGRVVIGLDVDARTCRLSVSNEGPPLPPDLDGKLFESLVGSRASANGKPHLGLGLYIVRLIADFHRGKVTAANLPDNSGVVVVVEVPRMPG
jgi:two-component system, OmpR family, sensor histidine kinase ChvG